jgi:hypothetical protein
MLVNTISSPSDARKIIDNWDFTPIVERSIQKGMLPQQAYRALAELREFLLQRRLHPGIDLSPQSDECDDLWHEFIVADTRAYFSFCDTVYGQYLHHNGVTLSADRLDAARKNSASVFGVASNAMCG